VSRLRPDAALQLRLVRVWLPLVVVVVGVVFMVLATDLAGLEGGALVVSAGLSIWLLNWLYRIGIAGEGERTREDDARAYLARHGHWPDEAPPARAPAREDVEIPPRGAPRPQARPHPHRTAPRRVERPKRPRRR
jgi:hypothetical protein